ncbi:MAG: hypothetical protein FGM45_07640, partial [Actinobacteria bacterium]|nr:hypothetical protein [Actinomycetota bacterium]
MAERIFSRRQGALGLVVALALLGVATRIELEASAVGPTAPTFELLSSGAPAANVIGGQIVTSRISSPVDAAGTSTVEITSSWSATTSAITGAGDVTAPSGWTKTFTSDGTNYVANPASWASVIGVKAVGSVTTSGFTAASSQYPLGLQNVTASAGGTVRPTLGNFQGGAAGDGWNAFHGDGYIFNIYHHAASPSWGIDCHIRASTGTKCWPSLNGAAFNVPGYDSPAHSAGFADEARDRVWSVVRKGSTGNNLGMLCISYAVNPPVVCPSVGDNGYVGLGVAARTGDYNMASLGDLVEYNGKLYTKSLDANSPMLCLDLSLAAACSGSPYYGVTQSAYSSPEGYWNVDRMKRFGNRIYVTHNQRFFDCFDLSSNLRCTNGTWPVTSSAATFVGPLFAVTSNSGQTIQKVCMHSGAGGTCFTTDGAT